MKKRYTDDDVLAFNQRHLDEFRQTKIKDRLFFISHCLRPELIRKIKGFARRVGYREDRIFEVSGFTAVELKLKEFNCPPFVGIACPREILQAEEGLETICAQAIALSPFKCPVDQPTGESEVDLKEVVRVLSL